MQKLRKRKAFAEFFKAFIKSITVRRAFFLSRFGVSE